MKTIAILKDGVVVNLIVGIDAESVPKPKDHTAIEVPQSVFIDLGLVYNTETSAFETPQPEPQPQPEAGDTV